MSELAGITRFKADIEKFAAKLDVDAETARQKLALDMFAQIRQRTPVKTGRARANWDITVGAPSERMDDSTDAPPIPADLGDSKDQPIYITNNLPYIEPLEHGHSKQAPAGMVEPTLESAAARVQSVIGTPD